MLKIYWFPTPLGIKWNSLRMFNVYGPGQDITKPDQGIVGIFLNQLLASPKFLKGSTTRTRDLVYIDDVVSAWLHVFRSLLAIRPLMWFWNISSIIPHSFACL